MKMNKFFGLVMVLVMALAFSVGCPVEEPGGNEDGNGNGNGNGDGNGDGKGDGTLASLSSMEIVKKMGAGWNLGNTLDSQWNDANPWTLDPPVIGQETIWNNPKTTKVMIDKVKEAGFNTVRVPTTWYIATGAATDYKIEKAWLDRVQEVVDYVIDNGMFCILNLHHEDSRKDTGYPNNGWLYFGGTGTVTTADKNTQKERMGKLWEQIAGRFKDYDEHLIFEGLNEPGMHEKGGWTAAKAEFLNELLQIFVDKVRASGGKNADRHLMIPPFCAAINLWSNKPGELNAFLDSSTKKLKVNDTRGRLIVSLHYYEPYGFCMAPSTDQYYRSTYNTSDSHISSNRNAVLDSIKNFTNNGIPVVMGETGSGKGWAEAERVKWANDYVKKVHELGVSVVFWDDGGNFQLLNRKANPPTWVYPDLVTAFVNSAK